MHCSDIQVQVANLTGVFPNNDAIIMSFDTNASAAYFSHVKTQLQPNLVLNVFRPGNLKRWLWDSTFLLVTAAKENFANLLETTNLCQHFSGFNKRNLNVSELQSPMSFPPFNTLTLCSEHSWVLTGRILLKTIIFFLHKLLGFGA